MKLSNTAKFFLFIILGALFPLGCKASLSETYSEDTVWLFRLTCLAAVSVVIPVLSFCSLFIPKNRFFNTGDAVVILASAFLLFVWFIFSVRF